MKIMIFPATTTTLLLVLLYLSTMTIAKTHIHGTNVVTDVYGDPVKAGQNYYLSPYGFSATGGGLEWTQVPGSSNICPDFYVSQAPNNLDFGHPITLYPKNSREKEISVSSNVQISFSDFSLPPGIVCYKSYTGVWGITRYYNSKTSVVKLTGNSLFTVRVDASTDAYFIHYCEPCPRIIGWFCMCGPLGIVSGVYGGAALGINNTNPIPFVFEPAWSFQQRAAALYSIN